MPRLLYGAIPLFRTNFPRCHALLSFVTSSLASPMFVKRTMFVWEGWGRVGACSLWRKIGISWFFFNWARGRISTGSTCSQSIAIDFRDDTQLQLAYGNASASLRHLDTEGGVNLPLDDLFWPFVHCRFSDEEPYKLRSREAFKAKPV